MFTNFDLGHGKEKTHVFGQAKTITVQHMDTFASELLRILNFRSAWKMESKGDEMSNIWTHFTLSIHKDIPHLSPSQSIPPIYYSMAPVFIEA